MSRSAAVTLPYLDGTTLRGALPTAAAVDALEQGLKKDPLPSSPPRSVYSVDGGALLVMSAWGEQGIGVKLMTLEPGNPSRGLPLLHGAFVLFAADDKRPVAVLDGAALTALRTAAVSALATRHLSRPDARRLLIFGAGRQAHAHLEAMCAVRPIESVAIVDPVLGRARGLVEHALDMGLDATVGSMDGLEEADVVCCCTTSEEPVVDGSRLSQGVHINAMGAYRPDMREVDTTTLRRSRVIVETREAALAEAGDLLIPLSQGAWTADDIDAELAEVVRGPKARRDPEEITLFKSVGVAFEDLIVARAAMMATDGGSGLSGS
jgi:ornithine cyclodeaminase